MTARQQRRMQQKAERRARKLERRRQSQMSAASSNAPDAVAPSSTSTVQEPKMPAANRAAISERKIAANQANAQLSTGPVSSGGKQIVSQNATRHGLTGVFHVLPSESQADFDALLSSFMRDEAPADQEEVQMVQYMAEATWLSRRAVRFQDQCFIAIESGSPEEQKQAKKDLALYLRYMAAHDRAYYRHSAELRRRRNERLRRERGFVSQQYREAAERRREATETRRQELHNLKVEREKLKNQRFQPASPSRPAIPDHLAAAA
jgi:hypothetical protein